MVTKDHEIIECKACGETFDRHKRYSRINHKCVHIEDPMPEHVRVEFRRVHEDGQLPLNLNRWDVGYDLFSIETARIYRNSCRNIAIGIQLSCPEGYYFTIEPRSSLAIKNIAPIGGIIDGTYTGDLFVMLFNFGGDDYTVTKGDKVAQLILHRIRKMDMIEVDKFSERYSLRGNKGIGSQGR